MHILIQYDADVNTQKLFFLFFADGDPADVSRAKLL